MELAQAYAAHVAHLEREYARLLALHGLDGVVIHSGLPRARSDYDDQFWPLRPTPHFQHWLPLAQAGCALVVAPGIRPRLLWLREQNYWEHVEAPASDEWRSLFDVRELARIEPAGERPAGRLAFIGEDAAAAAAWGLQDARNPPALMRDLDRLRALKTPYEARCLAEANRLAAVGHRRVAEAFGSGEHSELELHLLYLQSTAQDDPETPYKNIVALDANAATLHHVTYGRRPPPSRARTLLLDAGATFRGYTSDVTRTHVRSGGAAADTFSGLVQRVESMQQRLCAEVKIGLPYERLHERAHEEVGRILVDSGIARMSPEEAVASGVSRVFFPHGLGHALGLQCHDVGCAEVKPKVENPFLRNTTVIAEHQVFTIEPGIYFIDLLLAPLRAGAQGGRIDWELVEALTPLGGVRIEDDVHVTQGRAENLTRAHLPG